jgi:glycosyltransferase involved in cell wall biosynthesis
MIAVTFVVDRLDAGGAERHAIGLANGLDRHRFKVGFQALKPGGGLEGLLAREHLDSFGCVNVTSRLEHRAINELAARLEASGTQIVIATNPFATLYAILAARRAPSRPIVVSTFHSTVLPGPKNQLHMLFYRLMYPFCDALVYVCENQRRYWRRRALRPHADHVIYNGIDVEHFSADALLGVAGVWEIRSALGFGPDDYVVGICAALRPEKAHCDLLGAVARVVRSGTAIRCMIIGDGPERGRIETSIASLGLTSQVRITGFQIDVRPFVAACDVMALTSHHTETFSLSALESMAMGKPLIMTHTGGAAEQVESGRNGLLFEPGDIETLAKHLLALSDRAVSRRLGEEARRIVRERFRHDCMIAKYEALFDGLAIHANRVRC